MHDTVTYNKKLRHYHKVGFLNGLLLKHFNPEAEKQIRDCVLTGPTQVCAQAVARRTPDSTSHAFLVYTKYYFPNGLPLSTE